MHKPVDVFDRFAPSFLDRTIEVAGYKIWALSLDSGIANCNLSCHQFCAVKADDGTEIDLGEVPDHMSTDEMRDEVIRRLSEMT